jgi:hypothetical protein
MYQWYREYKKIIFHHLTFDSHSICSYSFFLSAFPIQQIFHGIRAGYITLSQFHKQESELASQESTLPSVRRLAIEAVSSTHEAREETKSKIDQIQNSQIDTDNQETVLDRKIQQTRINSPLVSLPVTSIRQQSLNSNITKPSLALATNITK